MQSPSICTIHLDMVYKTSSVNPVMRFLLLLLLLLLLLNQQRIHHQRGGGGICSHAQGGSQARGRSHPHQTPRDRHHHGRCDEGWWCLQGQVGGSACPRDMPLWQGWFPTVHATLTNTHHTLTPGGFPLPYSQCCRAMGRLRRCSCAASALPVPT